VHRWKTSYKTKHRNVGAVDRVSLHGLCGAPGWRGYHLIAVGFITFALLMAGVAMEAARDNQDAATKLLQQP